MHDYLEIQGLAYDKKDILEILKIFDCSSKCKGD